MADRVYMRGSNVAGTAPAMNYPAPAGYHLTFIDDFNGPAGSAPNSSRWNGLDDDNDFGGGVQVAKLLSTNAYLDGGSNLVIRTARESSGGASYTSGQISTAGKFQQIGGRWEYRIWMPAGGSGVWPAAWQLAANWPTGGETDTVEMFNDTTNAHGYYHYGPDEPGHQFTGGSNQTGLSAGYHTFVTESDPGVEIRWYIDGVLKRTFTDAVVSSSPMWSMLDVYVGGAAGDPAGTAFPQFMLCDWVRVYQRN